MLYVATSSAILEADARTLITTIDFRLIRRQCARITEAHTKWRSRGVRRILGGLMTSYPDFQTYLRHPKLNLPTTTNAAESCVAGCQELKRRLRGFRSEESMQLWLTGHALWKKTIVCNGKKTQK